MHLEVIILLLIQNNFGRKFGDGLNLWILNAALRGRVSYLSSSSGPQPVCNSAVVISAATVNLHVCCG